MTQQEALNLLIMGKNVYLTGQAGSGKTYLLNLYIDFLKKHKVGVAVTASTGIAATHINGMTIHSWSGIGIKNKLTNQDLTKIASNKKYRSQIQSAKVLIIDEISMFHAYRLDMVNEICKMVRQNDLPFGGLQVILCGDFFQLPPINEQESEFSSFAYKAKSWQELDLTICYLDEQHRQLDDVFLKLLNDIRSQDVSEDTFEKLAKRLNKEIESKFRPTRLYTHNMDVDMINKRELEKINKPERSFGMLHRGKKEIIEALKKGCLAPEILTLREDAVVMFIKNNPAKGYINGTLGIVTGFDDDGYPLVETFRGKIIVASPASWKLEEEEIILAEISQIPLRLAWAITVHKSQGMSLDAAEIDLSKSFTYGMGYVALSRVKSLEGIKLLGINPTALMVDGEIAEFDLQLKKLSNEVSNYLENLGESRIRKMQQEYINKIIPEKESQNKGERDITDLFDKYFG